MEEITDGILKLLLIERNCNYNDRTINKREKQQIRKICNKINHISDLETEKIVSFFEN